MSDARLPAQPLGIHSWARATDADVEERHLAVFGRGFRRIGSYVKLAQVGAQACLAAAAPGVVPEHTRVCVFMGSGLGNTEIAVPLAEGILHAEKPWCSPMAFAGSVGNAAAFYVARSIAHEGMNVTVSQEELSFEAALRRFTPGICRPSRRLEPVSRRVRCAEPASYTGGLGSWVGLPAVELLGWGSGWRRGGWPVKATTRGCGSGCAPSPDDRLLSETALLRFPFAPRV